MAIALDNKFAKRLAREVVEAGESALTDLKPALEKLLTGRSTRERKAFLKAFHKAAVREIQKDTLTVESATPLEAATLDQLVQHFAEAHARPLNVVQTTNPELIAGMRVRLGDSVYDASLANNLNHLSARIR